jgi:hypothetical protein
MKVEIVASHNLTAHSRDVHLRLARGARIGAERLSSRAKLAYRGAVRRAGLGDRLANTMRADIYPKSASVRTHAPAVHVYSKAPIILTAHATGVHIKSQNGTFLAIPTENTPRKGRRLATPVEVEAQFNQDLIFIHGRGQQMLAFVDVVRAKSGKGFRKQTKRRAKDGREKNLVLMFVMVRSVHLRKRVDLERVTAELASEWPELFSGEIAKQLSA